MDSAVIPSRVRLDTQGHPVHFRVEEWQFGPGISLVHVESSGHRLTRTPRHLRIAAPERISLSVQLAGRSRLCQGDLTWVDSVGELELVDLTSTFDYLHAGAGVTEALYIDHDHLGLPVDVVRKAAPRLQDSPLYDLVLRHFGQLRRVADRVDASHVQASHTVSMLGTATIELVRALIASAADYDVPASSRDESLFTQITAYLRLHAGDMDLTPARIAATHNISVRSLHALFAEHENSVHEWLMRERLEGARRDLARSSTASIAATGRAWGFSDPGHFARRFRAAYGMSPGQWRRLREGSSEPQRTG